MFSLDNVSPFNKCFYYNCVHSCLFAIIEANEGDYRKIMLSGVPHFAVDNNTQRLYTKFDFLCDYKELFLEQGIITECFSHIDMDVNDCIKYAINCIRNNKPIIINVDCYELTYREDLYHKAEWPHSLLVIDYDEEKALFKVIDQPNRDSVEFAVFHVSKTALTRAIYCYNKNRVQFQKYFGDMIASFECRFPGKVYDNKTLLLEWKECKKKVLEPIEEGNVLAKIHLETIVRKMTSIKYRHKYRENILDGLNDIVKQKRWENYLMKELCSKDDQILTIQSQLLQKWILLRQKIALILLSSKYRKTTVDSVDRLISPIFELENTLTSTMVK